MLKIDIESDEKWDEVNECFVAPIKQTVFLEHSLVSVSKWESRWHKPYLSEDEKTFEENLYYIQCMVTNKNFDQQILLSLTDSQIQQIADYINDPMTATIINRQPTKGPKKSEIMTSEIIYYYMTVFNIPVEFQKWHLNRLITLIQVCDIKQDAGKPVDKKETVNKYAEMNAARRKQLGTKG